MSARLSGTSPLWLRTKYTRSVRGLQSVAVDFELLGSLADIETIAAGRGIRDLPRLRRLYGKGYWRKMKGTARVKLRNGKIRLAQIQV
jgi:hypothetical protein